MKWRLLLVIAVYLCGKTSAQENTAIDQCVHSRQSLFAQQKTTVLSIAEDNYDIKYVKFDLSLTNTSTAISGNVLTTAQVVTSSMNAYVFELTNQLTIDSVKINGQLRPFTDSGYLHTVNFSIPISQGNMFTAQVYYHGTPEPGNAFFTKGLCNDTVNDLGMLVTWTLSEPYSARDWWPCKQSLTDKIDSADIWITVPDGLMAGSNGVLQPIVSLPSNKQRYEWRSRYPVDYYLLSIAVAPYSEYSFHVRMPDGDSVFVQNFIYDDLNFFVNNKTKIDSVALMLPYLATVFGPYPFADEKYGHCLAPLPGGMEHQTMTTLVDFGATLVAHELAHQWWGDNVTCRTWKDIWLNEGFATYTEYLFVNNFRGEEAGKKYLQYLHGRVMPPDNSPWGSIYVDDTTSPNRIFSGSLSYAKAAAVIHMMRYMAGSDNMFFKLLRDYQQQFGGGNASTEEFRQLAEQVLGRDLDTFFTQWIYKEGYPVYSGSWNQVNNDVFIKLKHENIIPTNPPVFVMPVEIKLLSETGDTVVTAYNTKNTEQFRFNWNRRMTGIVIDPNNWLLNGDGVISHDPAVGLDELFPGNIAVLPNPSISDWYIYGLNDVFDLALIDIVGKINWKGNNSDKSITINGDNIARGQYFLRITKGKKKITTLKLIKL